MCCGGGLLCVGLSGCAGIQQQGLNAIADVAEGALAVVLTPFALLEDASRITEGKKPGATESVFSALEKIGNKYKSAKHPAFDKVVDIPRYYSEAVDTQSKYEHAQTSLQLWREDLERHKQRLQALKNEVNDKSCEPCQQTHNRLAEIDRKISDEKKEIEEVSKMKTSHYSVYVGQTCNTQYETVYMGRQYIHRPHRDYCTPNYESRPRTAAEHIAWQKNMVKAAQEEITRLNLERSKESLDFNSKLDAFRMSKAKTAATAMELHGTVQEMEQREKLLSQQLTQAENKVNHLCRRMVGDGIEFSHYDKQEGFLDYQIKPNYSGCVPELIKWSQKFI